MYRYCLLLLGLALAAGCGGTSDEAVDEVVPTDAATLRTAAPAFRNVSADVAFVGDDACFSCHEDQYTGYQGHGMAHSFYRLTAETAVEQLPGPPVHHAPTGYTYRAFEEDGRYYQEEVRVDAAGRRTHRLVREMEYVVGSGTAARTYLTEENGRYYELPLTWYTQAEKWDLSPGYDVVNQRFDRTVPDRCMACHNGYPETVPFAPGKYTAVPMGIGCERCHGPGGLHVEERLEDPEPAEEIDWTIVNPAHLDLDRRLDVCQQCHLHAPVSVLREGRDPFGFRPSQALAAHVSLYYPDAPATSGQIDVISHADRMKSSACFLASVDTSAPMDCTTCHDPHQGFRTKGPAYFDAACLDCHDTAALQARVAPAAQPQHTAEANCISCHMPKVEAEDAPHSSFTDHWIRVVRDAETAPDAGDGALKPYFADDEDDPILAGMAQIIYGRQTGDAERIGRGIDQLQASLAETSERGEAHYLLGYALLQQGQVGDAIGPLERAVRLDASIPERLNTLAQAYEGAGRAPSKIEGLYQRALQLQPALASVRVNYGRFLETQGRLVEAMRQYRLAADEEPWLVTAHYNLGTGYLQQGQAEEARAAFREALALEPTNADVLTNLGILDAMGGDLDGARQRWQQAVEARPTHPRALGNLGAYYLNEQEDLDRAIDLLQRAVDADPGYADGFANLALAYFRSDRLAEARQSARRALAVNPDQALARQILAAL